MAEKLSRNHTIRYECGSTTRTVKAGSLSPGKAIRAKCLDCSGGSTNEVKACEATDCPLWPFRFGKNPFRTPRVLTDEQRAAAAERFAAARSNR